MAKAPADPDFADIEQAEAHFRAVIDRNHLASTTALVVCCDAQARPTHQWHVVECDAHASPSECSGVLNELLSRVEHGPPVTGLALGLTRPGGEEVAALRPDLVPGVPPDLPPTRPDAVRRLHRHPVRGTTVAHR